MITREELVPYISVCIDDAMSVRSIETMPADARLVGWQAGFEPMVIAVWSYLPGVTLEDSEAAEIATEYLEEIDWFSDGPTEPDFII